MGFHTKIQRVFSGVTKRVNGLSKTILTGFKKKINAKMRCGRSHFVPIIEIIKYTRTHKSRFYIMVSTDKMLDVVFLCVYSNVITDFDTFLVISITRSGIYTK